MHPHGPPAASGPGDRSGGSAAPPPDGVVLATPARRSRRGVSRAGVAGPPHPSRRRWPWVAGVAGATVLVAVVATVGLSRVFGPLGHPQPRSTGTAPVVVPGAAPALPWPGRGQGAVRLPTVGVALQSGPEASVPIASLTKITTAVVVLRDHPLAPGAPGPTVTITPEDYAEYDFEVHHDESSVPVHAGQQLTQRQLLEAMLTQSANDAAFALATWDAGTVPAFVGRMNALAASLGMGGTRYVDASGYDQASVSTAADVLAVTAAGMALPAFAEIVAMPSITFPGVGTLPNIVPEVGVNGVIGVKSGYTSRAGACMVLAADQNVHGRTVPVLVAVLGQPTPPPVLPTTTTTTRPPPTTTTTTTTVPGAPPPPPPPPTTTVPPRPAGPTTTTTSIPYDELVIPDPFKFTRPVVEALLEAARRGVVPVLAAPAHQPVGSVGARWGGRVHGVAAVTARDAWLAGWPGGQVASTVTFGHVAPGAGPGTVVGSAAYALSEERQSVPVVLAGPVPEPTWWWRLLHGR